MSRLLPLVFCASAALAEPPEAVARFEGPKGPDAGTCSAVMIGERIAVTAAHCGRNAVSGGPFHVRFGVAANDAIPVHRAAVHPLYRLQGQGVRRFRFDVALLELSRASDVAPLRIGKPAVLGEVLHIAPWRAGEDRPAPSRPCDVIAGRAGLVTLACAVSGGESGGAVLRQTDTGWEVVAILTSRGRQGDIPIAQATDLDGRIAPILKELSDSK